MLHILFSPLKALDRKKATPKKIVASSKLTNCLRLPNCDARTANATVKLLQIRTAVFKVPASKFKLRLPAANSGKYARR